MTAFVAGELEGHGFQAPAHGVALLEQEEEQQQAQHGGQHHFGHAGAGADQGAQQRLEVRFGQGDYFGRVAADVPPHHFQPLAEPGDLLKPKGRIAHALFHQRLGVIQGLGRLGHQLGAGKDQGQEEDQGDQQGRHQRGQARASAEEPFHFQKERPGGHAEHHGPEHGPQKGKDDHDTADDQQGDDRHDHELFDFGLLFRHWHVSSTSRRR